MSAPALIGRHLFAEAVLAVRPDELVGPSAGPDEQWRGHPTLRRAVAEHLSTAGVPTDPDAVLVTTGARQALRLAVSVHLWPGAVVAVERPSPDWLREICRGVGATVRTVRLDSFGMHSADLARVVEDNKVALVHVMPTCQDPTGINMPRVRRAAIADTLRKYRVPVIENHVGAPLDLLDRRPASLVPFLGDHSDAVSIGALGQVTWGGVRVGWLRGRADVVERLVRQRAMLAEPGPSLIDQLVLARLMPHFTELSAEGGALFRERLARTQELIARQLPDWSWQHPSGGQALWVRLPRPVASPFAAIARRYGVRTVPERALDPSAAEDRHIRLPLTVPVDQIPDLVARLRQAWSEIRDAHGRPSRQTTRPPNP